MIRVNSLLRFAAAALCLCAGAGVLSTAASAKTLRVGATSTGIPFTFLDVKTNTIEGMMVDTAHAVAKAAGYEAEIQQTVFSALIPSLTSNKLDVISAAMIKTDERAKVVDFTDPVYETYGDGLLVRTSETNDYKTLDDLKGKVVGAQAGTTYYNLLMKKGYFKEIRTYDSIADMARDLALGRIDAGVADKPIMAYQIQQGTLKDVKLVQDYKQEAVGSICLVVRKGDDELRKALNDAIAKVKASGELDKIIAKWGI
ncbi:ABC transporter substrate-binding protein [Castellaniella sp. S9]|uniref:ABC transporter substrate-binding protein n=1 Tax=Castellaniella sp. S9 TaxID=2993652 RepID=UPI0022B4F70F|nr:ABC transporter substrate-binding protein [Castellaniella sp. S9]